MLGSMAESGGSLQCKECLFWFAVSGLSRATHATKDGQVSYTEFVAGALRLSDLDPKRCDRLLRYAFEVFDLDGDGGLDMTELSLMLSGAEGHLADVLPDGSTVEQVMEDSDCFAVSCLVTSLLSALSLVYCAPEVFC